MRLTTIKLSGFKSFVDPTIFRLPSSLVGIVGPNGCGKSNLIDAVRWVMGESSAKQLRGDSMADVIFNGSSARKPVGQASIELVFDNSDRRVTGPYAGYDEIGIRRILQRDGQSAYYLNGTRCRRRDITDIFLGTGLGPRSYSIIEQGMISRVIEAGPEQLRGFLEEAAGISKYKERRRETENRIRHTRDNLSRVNDLRDELGRQLERLQRQARNAERYRELKQEERGLKAGVLALRWSNERDHMDALGRDAAESQLALDRVLASVRSLEARIEQGRVALGEANDQFGEVQGRYYGAGSEVARIEQTIKHSRELRSRHEEDLRRTVDALEDLERHADSDRRHISDLEAYLSKHAPELEEARQREAAARDSYEGAEREQSAWRASWDSVQERVAQRQRDAEVTHARIDHGEGQLADMARRLERLRTELEGVSEDNHESEITDREARIADLDAGIDSARATLVGLETALRADREGLESGERELHELRERLESDQGRESSLRTLQRAALNQDGDALTSWLESQGLEHADRLAHGIKVEPGWETALESALSGRLDAVCVQGLNRLGSETERLREGRMTLFEAGTDEVAAEGDDPSSLVPLLRHVHSEWSLRSLLIGVYVTDDIDAALVRRGALAAHESFVTRNGARVGPNWLEWSAGDEPSQGILARARQLEEVERAIRSTRHGVAEQQDTLESIRAHLGESETHLASQRGALQELREERTHLSAETESLRRRADQAIVRRQQIEQDIAELDAQQRVIRASVGESRAALERMITELADASSERERRSKEGAAIESALGEWRNAARDARNRVHELSVQVESRRSSLESLRRGLARLDEQQASLNSREGQLAGHLANGEQPLREAEEELAAALENRGTLEEELASARNRVEIADAHLRELDRDRTSVEQEADGIRDALGQLRVAMGEARVRCENLAEQLSELRAVPETVLADLPSDADVVAWQSQLDTLAQRIQRLGAINLAAIEEFAREKERKEYLDAQCADLNEALETLESAIAKIDRETRSRFQDVYRRVNDGLGDLFPRLFGGGQAFLELVGEDALDAGVAVMARPPGKRISNIHLLSGGEKALTAAALVFSIFQLNPAPFCMLDEVDAPLDEANVSRFCDLVREMSAQVQFIVITHNKTTMEVLDQLVGVTMHEPGCSRVVAVDVDEAVRLAAV